MSRPNVVRRTVIWWFQPPTSPYVTVNFAVDATNARAYLARLAERGVRITLNQLVAAAIARTLVEHPYANGRIIGERLVLAKRVGIAMPVNLLDAAGLRREVSMATVADVDQLTLGELATRATRTLDAERAGEPKNPLIRTMFALGEWAPQLFFRSTLRAVDAAVNTSYLGDVLYHQIGVTTALSNVGAATRAADGLWFRGADIHLPQRLMQVGTFWATGALQDEVVPVDGAPAIRPILPCVLLFDHRLVDGVRGTKLVQTFAALLRDPEAAFGAEGSARIGG